MFKLFPIRVLLYQLYLLQLEEYAIPRYVKLILKSKGLPVNPTRKQIDWTQKLLAVFLVAFGIQAVVTTIVSLILYRHFQPVPIYFLFIVSLIIFLLSCYIFFVFLLISLVIITPLDSYLKKKHSFESKSEDETVS